MKFLGVITLALISLFPAMVSAQVAPRNLIVNPQLKPFYHGVASGSPTAGSVVLWTRITPDTISGDIGVEYAVATDTLFQNVVQTGTATALEAKDFTIKVTISGLQPDAVYFYYFRALGANSLVGRARTSPTGPTDHLRFGVVSCSNYQSGYFNAYGHLATHNDLNAVLHLGDYIYEYGAGSSLPDRLHQPDYEVLTLADYRTRYSLYRLDPHLIRLHQQHTVISVWDDHESANDSYTNGAQNHQSDTEGQWEVRKAISKQVYFEWMPVADNPDQSVYRRVPYGDLCDLFMLDTRLEGRDMPPPHFDTPEPPERRIISETQEDWLLDGLATSQARWKVLGNQVLFSTFNVGFAAGILDGTIDITNIDSIRQVEDAFIDNWESYPTQRNRIIDFLKNDSIQNTVIVTGDSHCSWAFDVTKEAVKYPVASAFNIPQPNLFNAATGEGYDKTTGNGSYAVEFGVPSISSSNFDELVGVDRANQFEAVMGAPIAPFNIEYNPHLKYVDLDRHGYIILDLRPDTAQANFYYVENPLVPSLAAGFGQGACTVNNDNRVLVRTVPSAPKVVQDIPAPLLPFGVSSVKTPDFSMELLGIMPNPARDMVYVQIAVNQSQPLRLSLYRSTGALQWQLPWSEAEKGMALQSVDLRNTPAGVYWLVLEDQQGRRVAREVVKLD